MLYQSLSGQTILCQRVKVTGSSIQSGVTLCSEGSYKLKKPNCVFMKIARGHGIKLHPFQARNSEYICHGWSHCYCLGGHKCTHLFCEWVCSLDCGDLQCLDICSISENSLCSWLSIQQYTTSTLCFILQDICVYYQGLQTYFAGFK